jgi:hypothetical protein
MANLIGGAGQRFFADPAAAADETTFQVTNTDSSYYTSPYYKLHQSQLQPVPPPSVIPPRVDFAAIVGATLAGSLTAAKRIEFHAVGDTGAAKVSRSQTAPTALEHQARVADAMAAEVEAGGPGGPAFFFHLGDIIYNFGEDAYYYDQFYEPYRHYDRPIFAIPGNHDAVVIYGGPNGDTPTAPSLTGFMRNFCAPAPGPSPDAGSITRSTMTQPGPYFTLDAPCVSIIGLYTNVLEGPGVISTQGGTYPVVGDDQLTYLTNELERLAPQRANEERAVIIACHHPPLSVDSAHGGTTGLGADLDQACTAAGLWPDAVLSGHAHLYQRFTRNTAGHQIPYITSGSGGFSITPPRTAAPPAGTVVGDTTLEIDPLIEFGFLNLTVDLAATPPTLTIEFHVPTRDKAGNLTIATGDRVAVNLTTNQLLTGPAAPGARKAAAKKPAHKPTKKATPRRRPQR